MEKLDSDTIAYLSIAFELIFYLLKILVPIFILYFLAKRFVTKRTLIVENTRTTNDTSSLEKFPVKVGNKVILVPEDQIIYFRADDNFVHLFDREGNKYLMDITIGELLNKLPTNYLKIHRSTIINSNKILEIQKYLNGRYALVMDDAIKSKLMSSRSNAQSIKTLYQI